jgi:hypothetical protein
VLADDVIAKSGDALFVIEPGAISYRFDGFAECTNPIASLDVLPQLSSATFEIQDSTRKIVCNLDSALVARTASLVPDGPWVGAPGQKLTVRWPSQQELFTREMTVKIGDEELGILYHDYPDYDLMSFTVPLLPAGTYPLVIKRLNRPRDATCDDREIDGFISEEPDELRTFSVDLEII